MNPRKCTSIFEKEKLSEDFYYSWEAFIKYVVALGSARDTLTGNNVHWADYWDECKPCHFHYDYITHLDQEMLKARFRSYLFTSGYIKKCQIVLPSRKSSDILFPSRIFKIFLFGCNLYFRLAKNSLKRMKIQLCFEKLGLMI